MVSDCESDESIEDDAPQKNQKVNRYADNNLLQARKNLWVCKKDTGRCLRSLFSTEVYPATTVSHWLLACEV